MSHRHRDSDSRHHRSRSDREPSPKRVRRDGKTATEKPSKKLNLDSSDHTDRDEKHRRRMQDYPTREAPVKTDSKTDVVTLRKESDKKSNGDREGTKSSSHYSEAPRSRSNYQHDERAGPAGRSFRHRETTERGSWKDSKDRESGRGTNRSSNNGDTKPRGEVELDLKQSLNKRRSFRETKIPVDDKSATEVTKLPNGEGSERKEERGKPREEPPVNRHDRHKTEMQRTNYQSRDGYGGGGDGGFGGSFRGRDRFNGRQGQSGGRADKWKHDLYDEANKSPTSKNEEDQIAKVEALLAS